MKAQIPWGVGIAIVLITLAVWVFFNVMGMGLDPPATMVLTLIVAACVICVRWVWSQIRSTGSTK